MKNFLTTGLCLLVSLAVNAKVYKVANPDEFQKAAATVKPGDEIVIANGNYSNWALVIPTNGTAAKPVIIRAETPDKVVFSGDASKAIFQLTGSYTQLSGINFTGCNIIKAAGSSGILVEMDNSKYCRLTNCTFSKNAAKTQFMPIVVVGGNGEGNRVDHCNFISNIDNQEVQIKITDKEVPQHTLVDHNVFRDKAKVAWPVFNGGECVQVGQDPILLGNQAANSLVRDNRFIHCDGEPEVISNKSTGNRYISNYFEDCQGELVMRGGHDCLIDSNVFKGGLGGIRINGTHHTVTHNQIDNIKTAIRLMYGMAKGKVETGFYIAAGDCVIKDNRISNADVAILVGDKKNQDWTGKFDTKRYPSRTMQDVAPYDNSIGKNIFTNVKTEMVTN
ncbi:hypothetical protein HQ865_07135 [Mucilaginibacter mali]|uniref:Chondroitinase B-like protein n=1 Tax=Mucilaginibacter mali TaxID=2740462 RepID=A0A7D4TU77_9SPHI|nr:chondroitinase-B domain-containing protein [Mucilaginibacter mali]QKJ29535.1 hypothetical protein HQ865_07135 [Mucilaginibacter mali]